jgi:hypothetical protein
MKKALYFVIGALAVLSFSLVAAQSGLPGAGWESGQQIQNVGSGPANIIFTAYGQDGTSYDCGSSSSVAVGASVNFLTSACPVSAGFLGSAVVSADQEIAAIVNVTNRTVGKAAGQYKGTDGASTATTVNFPIVKHNFFGRTTAFYMQNAGTTAVNIQADFTTTSGSYSHTYTNVPANAMVVVSPADASVPSGDLGSLTVTSTNALAGSSLEYEHGATVGNNLQASRGFTAADEGTTVFCPLYRKNHTARSFSTGAQVQNVSGAAASVDFTFTYAGGSYADTQTVQPGESYTFFSGSIAAIPNGALGSVKVESDQNVVVVVSDRGFGVNPSPLTAYACFSVDNATTDVTIPLYKEYLGGNSSGLQIQNVGNAATTNVTVTYAPDPSFFPTKSPVTFSYNTAVAAGESVTFFGVSQSFGIPAGVTVTSGTASTLQGTFGGVTISADQPIVVIANESSLALSGQTPSGQDNKNYEGFNQ